jgi:hypothetical protein
MARYVHNDRLLDALHSQAFAALTASPGARAYYDRIQAREVGHHAALRQLANRLAASCTAVSKTGTLYDETSAWSHQAEAGAALLSSACDVCEVQRTIPEAGYEMPFR